MDLKRSRLLKMGYLFFLGLLLFSCISKKENTDLVWYQHQVIE